MALYLAVRLGLSKLILRSNWGKIFLNNDLETLAQ